MTAPDLSLAAAASPSPGGGPSDAMALIRRADAEGFKDGGAKRLPQRAKFWLHAMRRRAEIGAILAGERGEAARGMLASNPKLLGFLVWPFLCASWSGGRNLEALVQHGRVVDAVRRTYRTDLHAQQEVADLSAHYPGLRIVLDQPRWFLREGFATVNAFWEDARLYSLSFAFGEEAGDRVLYLGSIQGRSLDGMNDVYRNMTKVMHGLRPRDLMIEIGRVIAQDAGCARMLGVADAHRYHHHPWFGGRDKDSTDYDEVWADRDGEPVRDGRFWAMDTDFQKRDLAEVKAKKRSLYKKRYAMQDEIVVAVRAGLASPRAVQFRDY